MNYIVKIEGQEIPVPEEIGATDEAVKRALAPFYPDAANAMITRVDNEGTVTITVVKRAGSKGLTTDFDHGSNGLEEGAGTAPLQALIECLGGKNPAVVLYEELAEREREGVDLEALLVLDGQIGQALEAGEKDFQAVGAAYSRLRESRPRPAPELVVGF